MHRITQLEQDILWRATLQHKDGKRGCLMWRLPSGFRIVMEDGKTIVADNILDLTKEMIAKGELKVLRSNLEGLPVTV